MRGQRGFSLIETLVALTIFAIVTVGVVPLLAVSVRGSGLSRSYTVGKNVAVRAMEHVRGLPFFVSYGTQTSRVDVLDFYFPSRTSNATAGQTYTEPGIFTTVCNAVTAPNNTACPQDLPEGHTITFTARFVNASDYSTAAWPSSYTYVWNPSSTSGRDTPPTRMMEMTARASWMFGTTRTFEVKTLIGDRRAGETLLGGRGRIDYGIQVVTSFADSVGTSTLVAVMGNAESRIEARQAATADQDIRAAFMRLIQDPTETNPNSATLDAAEAATVALHAPPSQTPAGTSGAADTITHPNLLVPMDVAFMDASNTSELHVSADNEIPAASGKFSFTPAQSVRDMWVHNSNTENSVILHLNPTAKMFSVRPKGSSRFEGKTTAASGAVTDSTNRRSETTSNFNMYTARLFPLAGVSDGLVPTSGVVIVDDFYAETRCKATGSSSTSSASSAWRATIRYWADANNNGLLDGGYVTVTLNGTTPVARSSAAPGTDPLASIGNPLVYDGLTIAEDVYLFKTATTNGYLKSFTSSAPSAAVTSNSQIADAAVESALRIDTAPSDPNFPESSLAISIGKLSCQAVDRR